MAVYVKRPDGNWDEVDNTVPNIKVKTGASTWADAAIVYVRTPSGWQIAWDNAAPAPEITSSSSAAYGASTSSITINWTQPTIYNFVKYQFTTDGGATWGDDSTNSALRSKTWNGLAENTSYTVGVRVVNVSGRTGTATTTRTTVNSFPAAVTNGSVTDQTSSSGKLNWTASTAGDLKGGGLSYAINNSNDTVRVGDTDSTSFTVTGLSQNSSYTYKVYARDSNDAYSSPISLTIDTTNAAPPAATVTASGTGANGTNYSSTANVVKNGTWRVQYSGEAVSAIAYLFDSNNVWTGRSSTLYESNNRQTSIDQYVTFGDLAPSAEYRVAVDVTDANSATTRSSYVGQTTEAAYWYSYVGSTTWYTTSIYPSSSQLSASTQVTGFEASKATLGSSSWWLSGTNSASASTTAYEYLQWDGAWPSYTAASVTHYSGSGGTTTSTPTQTSSQTTSPARYVSAFEYAAADTDQGAAGNASTTNGDFKVYFSVQHNNAWQGTSTIPYGGSNGYNINYVELISSLGGDGYGSLAVSPNRESSSLKVRFTMTNLRTHTGYTGYRASCFYAGISIYYAATSTTNYYR